MKVLSIDNSTGLEKELYISDFDQVTGAVGEDYVYYVLTDQVFVSNLTKGIRNCSSFNFQLSAAGNTRNIRSTIADINTDLGTLTALEISTGYILGFNLVRADVNKVSFAIIKLVPTINEIN